MITVNGTEHIPKQGSPMISRTLERSLPIRALALAVTFSLSLYFPTHILFAQDFKDALKKFIQQSPRPSLTEPFTETDQGCTRGRFSGTTWQGGVWSHPFLLCSAKSLKFKDALLLRISGTQNPEKYEKETAEMAERSQAHVAVIGGVPNQPLFGGKKEDKLLAHSFEQFRLTGDPSWPVLLPMVASVTSAIDIFETHFKAVHGIPALRVVTAGASKRGWTTWLSGTVDKRIVGIAPAVFDMLHIPEQVAHARRAYGRDSRMIRAYTELGLTDKLSEPRLAQLMKIVDPYSYIEKLTLPKLLILGTNDPYWVVDSLTLYEPKLTGDTVILMQPNIGHGALGAKKGLEVVGTWFSLIAGGHKVPTAKANLESGGSKTPLANYPAKITLQSNYPLSDLRMWSADSDDLDFRLSEWKEAPFEIFNESHEKKSASTAHPRYGLRAIMLEATAATPLGPLTVTSPAYVIRPISIRKPFEDL
jgi:PhoPQ-activated pathogenicity-related protein